MALPQAQRHKVTKSELEHTAQSATFVDNVAVLLLAEFFLEPEKLDTEWKEPFAKNDLAVTLEVQAALASKNPEFHPRSIKTLAALRLGLRSKREHSALRIDAHADNMPVGKSGKAVELTNLEADQWKLVRSRVDYDVQVLRVSKMKLSTWESAHYHQELTHRQNAWQKTASMVPRTSCRATPSSWCRRAPRRSSKSCPPSKSPGAGAMASSQLLWPRWRS